MEREILNAIDGVEDEDGNKSRLIGPSLDDVSEQEKVMFAPRQYNTGVKGCIVDEKRHRAQLILQRQADQVRAQEALRRSAMGGVRPVDNFVEEEDEFHDDDDKITARYTRERLQQMQAAASTAQLPTFGFLELIGVEDYLERVDGAGHRKSFVVLHLHEDYLAPCVRLNFKLEELAKRRASRGLTKIAWAQAPGLVF